MRSAKNSYRMLSRSCSAISDKLHVMKSKLIFSALLGLVLLVPQSSRANTVSGTPGAEVQTASGSAGHALSSLHFITEKRPSVVARYYIYLCSASWCGPCHKAMPHVVEAHGEMKADGVVELVLVCFDHSEADGRAYLSMYSAPFAGTMGESADRLPGFRKPHGIPHAIIVDADGHVIKEGHGSIAFEYKKHISDYEKEKGLPLSFPQESVQH